MLEHGQQRGSSASPYPSPRTLEPRGDAAHRATFAQVKQRPPETQWNFESRSLSSGSSRGVPQGDRLLVTLRVTMVGQGAVIARPLTVTQARERRDS